MDIKTKVFGYECRWDSGDIEVMYAVADTKGDGMLKLVREACRLRKLGLGGFEVLRTVSINDVIV